MDNGINCHHGNFVNLQSIPSLLNYVLLIRIIGTGVSQIDVNMIRNAIILITRHNKLWQPFPCHPALGSAKMNVLDKSFNKINKLHEQHFTCL